MVRIASPYVLQILGQPLSPCSRNALRISAYHGMTKISTGYQAQSTLASSAVSDGGNGNASSSSIASVNQGTSSATARPLARLPMPSLLRSLLLASLYTRPILLRPLMGLLNTIINAKSPLLNLSNPLFYAIIRRTVYDQFNAGTTPAEVKGTIDRIKKVGFQGVILGHAREIEGEDDLVSQIEECGERTDTCISKWLELNLETLALIGRGDYINVKVTGAGPSVTAALAANEPPSKQLMAAMDTIITTAEQQGSRVWIDAEQQVFQGPIDEIVIDLMRKYNRNADSQGGPLVWNTIQSYLKDSRRNLEHHVKVAGEEGWTLAIKLVRGAYIGTEERSKIWETKAGTDQNYNAIVNDIMRGKVNGMSIDAEGAISPKIWLYAAGHNTESCHKAIATLKELNDEGKPCPTVGLAQLQGMADEVSCQLLSEREEILKQAQAEKTNVMVPNILKCLSWGDVADCTHFLMRRTVENSSAADRIKEGVGEIRRELRKRILRF